VGRTPFSRQASSILSAMKIATGSQESAFTLSPGEEAELLPSIAEADRGEMVPVEEVLERLARRSGEESHHP